MQRSDKPNQKKKKQDKTTPSTLYFVYIPRSNCLASSSKDIIFTIFFYQILTLMAF